MNQHYHAAVRQEYSGWRELSSALVTGELDVAYPYQYWFLRHARTLAPLGEAPPPAGEVRLRGSGGNVEIDERELPNLFKVSRALADTSFHLAFCSPLRRAKQTMAVIDPHKSLLTIETPILNEWNLGAVSGLAVYDHRCPSDTCELGLRKPRLVKTWRNDPFSLIMPKGESLKEFCERAQVFEEAMRGFSAGKPGFRTLIVGHGYYGMALLKATTGSSYRDFFKLPLLDPLNLMIIGRKRKLESAKLLFIGSIA